MNQFNTRFRAVIFDFEGTIAHGNTIYDDARALVVRLKEAGVLLGIASNTSADSIRERLEKNSLLEYFDTIVGIDQVDFKGKPSPDLFFRAVENLSVEPQECLVIEDSESGAEGAHTAGIDVVLVRGKRSNHALFVCPDLGASELEKILF